MESPYKKPLTLAEVKQIATVSEHEETARLDRIEHEFARGFKFIESIPKSVSFFGSTRATEQNPNYGAARNLAGRLVKELGFAIVTGGGPGIMEAANRGAYEAGGISVGLTIELPTTQPPNNYLNNRCDFHYFFARKVALGFSARVYIFFPGGYGTLDEFFEIVTLIKENKIQPVPVVCVGAQFWEPLKEWMNNYLLIQNNAINDEDLGIFTVTDNADMVLEIVKNAPPRK